MNESSLFWHSHVCHCPQQTMLVNWNVTRSAPWMKFQVSDSFQPERTKVGRLDETFLRKMRAQFARLEIYGRFPNLFSPCKVACQSVQWGLTMKVASCYDTVLNGSAGRLIECHPSSWTHRPDSVRRIKWWFWIDRALRPIHSERTARLSFTTFMCAADGNFLRNFRRKVLSRSVTMDVQYLQQISSGRFLKTKC